LTEKLKQTAIRLPVAFITRIDRLAERMSAPGMPMTRSDVLRLAAFRGVEQLESDQKKARRSK
jgi:predicted DNA-binding protein